LAAKSRVGLVIHCRAERFPEATYRLVPPLKSFFTGFNTFPSESVSIPVRSLYAWRKSSSVERCRATGPHRPVRLEIDRSEVNLSWSPPPPRARDACMQSTLGGFVPPWNRSFSMETYIQDEQQ